MNQEQLQTESTIRVLFYLLLLKLCIQFQDWSLMPDNKPTGCHSGYSSDPLLCLTVWDLAIPKKLKESKQKSTKHQDSFSVCLSGLLKVLGSVKSGFKFGMQDFFWAILTHHTNADFLIFSTNIYNFIVNIKTLSKLLKTQLCACLSVCSCVCVCVCMCSYAIKSVDTTNELTFNFHTSQICFASVSLTFTPLPGEHVIIPSWPDPPTLLRSAISCQNDSLQESDNIYCFGFKWTYMIF